METGGAGDQGGGLVSLGWEEGPLIPEAGRLQELVLLQEWVGAGQGRSSRRARPSSPWLPLSWGSGLAGLSTKP